MRATFTADRLAQVQRLRTFPRSVDAASGNIDQQHSAEAVSGGGQPARSGGKDNRQALPSGVREAKANVQGRATFYLRFQQTFKEQ